MTRAATLPATAAEAMVTVPKTLPVGTTVGQVRAAFEDDHVHMLLLTSEGALLGTLVRADLDSAVPAAAPALGLATLRGRTVAPDEDLEEVRLRMIAAGRRRLAVVGPGNRLLGLLCLKRDQSGFCTDAGVAARARAGHP
ncbi:CBS domain-containing protein [Nocardioides speluncae]|uniref:CBS domain-containing protein n=1 Tax=Nocardioides speluncae TaxID=2670337 RepID=UPI000D697CCA|nr:CBS domain-containing protein [Nocardioides speluncae]